MTRTIRYDSPPIRSPAHAMRILIIEDDRDAADYLVKAFREVGHVADSRRRRGRAWRWRSTAATTC